jgi:uncharacterized protein
MLTAALRVYTWDRPTSSISSDRLEDDTLPFLERALTVYRSMVGRTRGQVRNAARLALEGLRPDRVEPVVKLVDDVATYEWPSRRRWAERRVRVFETAARVHPVLDAPSSASVLGESIGLVAPSHEETVADLYADHPEFHVLRDFPPEYGADTLRAEYDLAQAQALLYSATRVTVDAEQDFKHILRYARLARLLHRLERVGDGYRFTLDGPNSVLRRTRVYGVDFARFLAALVRTRDWRLTAEIELRKGWRPFSFHLTADDGLGAGRAPAPVFDSSLEEAFSRRFGAERDGWRLFREAAVLETAGSLLVPDFVFRHEDGTEVLLEIVGYWTPEYLDEKFRKLRGVRAANLLVAVPKALALRAGRLPAAVVTFARRLRVSDVLPKLEAVRYDRLLPKSSE